MKDHVIPDITPCAAEDQLLRRLKAVRIRTQAAIEDVAKIQRARRKIEGGCK